MVNTEELESSVEFFRESKLLVDDCNEEINGDSDPDLRLHRIGTGAEVVFDTQVPLDPFEEEFYLPAALVELCHCDGRDLEIVAQEDKMLGGLLVGVMHLAKRPREVGCRFWQRWPAYLIAANSLRIIPRQRAMAREAQVSLGASDEEGFDCCNASQSHKIHGATIHHVEGSSLE